MSFVDLGLQESLTTSIVEAGYEQPTELQEKLIPLMVQRENVLIWTQSAAGKTGAFLIPALDYILNNPLEEHQGARVLILTSRRDRVNQITYTVKRLLGEEQQVRTGFIVSGRPYQPQMRLLRRPLDLMIATPGRLNDLVDNNKADFSNIELLIIDDLTAIYQKELAELVDKIVAQKPEKTPVVAFVRHDEQATPYAKQLLPNAREITIEDEKTQLLQLPQSLYRADDVTHKLALTDHFLGNLQDKRAVIFTNTGKTAKMLADHLANNGYTADATHLLAEEERNLEACPILIVPDEEDFVPETDHQVPLIHFEIPEKAETYLNRLQCAIGSEQHSAAITLLASSHDQESLKKLEEFQGEKIAVRTIPGLEPKAKPQNKKAANKNSKTGKAGSGRKPQQRKAASAGRKNGASAATADKQRSRKGPYGRLNNGASPRKTGSGSGQNRATQNTGGGNYEIGGWENQDYAQKKPDSEKKVVIRYKEKKRRTLVKQTSD